ncbi:MAG: proprotein convertase P-domain-containing protein, partial [Caldilineaceae bacterium]|nr:proprotein convertase P-domain-containing protein [Caldilineaceae bacterium]
PCTAPLIYTLSFADNFTISEVEFEFVATHTYRGDIRVTLISPAGTSVAVIDGEGGGDDNLNVLLADDASGSIADGSVDDVASSTRRTAQPSNSLSPFIGQNAQGSWQVQICDTAPSDSGETILSLIRLFGARNSASMPFGYWPLDEGSGTTTADLTATAGTGTLRNGPSWTTTEKPAAIQFENSAALYFDGTDDYVDVPIPSRSFDSFTVAFWAKRQSTGRNDYIIGRGSPVANEGLHIGFRSTNVFTCGFWGDNDLNTAIAYMDTDWHHWACTYDHTTNQRKIFRDGRLVAQDTAANDYLASSGNLVMGRILPNQNTFYRGWLDDVRIYMRAMTDGEMRGLASGVQGDCSVQLPNGTVYTSSHLAPFPLQDAVDAANAGDTIKVAGTCTGVQMRGGQIQHLYLEKAITIEGGYSPSNWDTPDPRANPTTLDALEGGRGIFVNGSSTAMQVELRNLTLTGGQAPNGTPGTAGTTAGAVGTSGGSGSDGGGIFLRSATLTIRDSALHDNRAGDGGRGGDGSSTATTTGANGGTGGNGGYGGAIFVYNSVMNMHGVTIYENEAGRGGTGGTGNYTGIGGLGGRGGYGGAIYNQMSDIQITSTTIITNSAGTGGTGGAGDPDYNSSPLVNTGGAGGNGGAGAVYNFYGQVKMDHLTIANNYRGSGGVGGLNGAKWVQGSTGTPGNGGGLIQVESSATAFVLANSVVTQNQDANCVGTV